MPIHDSPNNAFNLTPGSAVWFHERRGVAGSVEECLDVCRAVSTLGARTVVVLGEAVLNEQPTAIAACVVKLSAASFAYDSTTRNGAPGRWRVCQSSAT